MSMVVKHAEDPDFLNRVGLFLFRIIMKARGNSRFLEQVYLSRKNSWHEVNDDTAIGYEASWEGIFPHPEKENVTAQRLGRPWIPDEMR